MRRRDFLTTATAATVAATLPSQAVAAPAGAECRNKQSGMTYRRLGCTGLMVSSIGMGGNTISPGNSDHVLWAIDHGLNYLDTSPTYRRGRSEEGYAGILKARGREKLILTSKISDEHTRDRTSYQQIFDSPYETGNHPKIFEAVEVLKKQGKVRFFGFSSYSDPGTVPNAANKNGMYSMAMAAYNFLNHSYVDEALENARKAGMDVLAMKAGRGGGAPVPLWCSGLEPRQRLGQADARDDLTSHRYEPMVSALSRIADFIARA